MSGFLARFVKIKAFLFIHVIMTIQSVVLATFIIPDDTGWFSIFGRNGDIVFTEVIYLLGQLVVMMMVKAFWNPNSQEGKMKKEV